MSSEIKYVKLSTGNCLKAPDGWTGSVDTCFDPTTAISNGFVTDENCAGYNTGLIDVIPGCFLTALTGSYGTPQPGKLPLVFGFSSTQVGSVNVEIVSTATGSVLASTVQQVAAVGTQAGELAWTNADTDQPTSLRIRSVQTPTCQTSIPLIAVSLWTNNDTKLCTMGSTSVRLQSHILNATFRIVAVNAQSGEPLATQPTGYPKVYPTKADAVAGLSSLGYACGTAKLGVVQVDVSFVRAQFPTADYGLRLLYTPAGESVGDVKNDGADRYFGGSTLTDALLIGPAGITLSGQNNSFPYYRFFVPVERLRTRYPNQNSFEIPVMTKQLQAGNGVFVKLDYGRGGTLASQPLANGLDITYLGFTNAGSQTFYFDALGKAFPAYATERRIGRIVYDVVSDTVTFLADVDNTVPPVPGVLTSIVVAGAATVNEGTSQQYVATGYYDNNTSKDITQEVTWSLAGQGATVSNAGSVTAPANNTIGDTHNVTLSASLAGVSQSKVLSIQDTTAPASALLTGITVTGPSFVNEGTTAQYTAIANYSDGTTVNITTQAIWSLSAGAAETVSTTGLLTAASNATQGDSHTISVSATFQSNTSSKSVTIADTTPSLTITAITITGASTVNEGSQAQYIATATYSNGSTGNVTSSVTWALTKPGSTGETLSAGGYLTVPTNTSTGDTHNDTITATIGSVTGTKTVSIANGPNPKLLEFYVGRNTDNSLSLYAAGQGVLKTILAATGSTAAYTPSTKTMTTNSGGYTRPGLFTGSKAYASLYAAVPNGTYTVTLLDEDGQQITYPITVTSSGPVSVLKAGPNSPPTVAKPLGNQTRSGTANKTVVVPSDTFSDPGDTLTYTASLQNGSALPAGITFDAGSMTYSILASVADGTYTLRTIATDTAGQTAADNFSLLIVATVTQRIVSIQTKRQPNASDAGISIRVQTTGGYVPKMVYSKDSVPNFLFANDVPSFTQGSYQYGAIISDPPNNSGSEYITVGYVDTANNVAQILITNKQTADTDWVTQYPVNNTYYPAGSPITTEV